MADGAVEDEAEFAILESDMFMPLVRLSDSTDG